MLDKPLRKPYRVVIWGTGSVGKICLREILARPEFELVGVYGYNKDKIGKDAAEIIGLRPCGIIVTSQIDAVVALKADCVLWTAGFPIGSIGKRMEASVIRLLESGANVVTCAAHHYPPAHGQSYVDQLEAACRKGRSSLHGTGENPGFFIERLAVTLCGCTNRVSSLVVNEYADVAKPGDKTDPGVMGFGMSAENLAQKGPVAEVWDNYYFVDSVNIASMALFNKPLSRFEVDQSSTLAQQDIEFSTGKGDPINFMVKQGTVVAITYNFRGFVDGENRITASTNWYLTDKYSPFRGKEDSTWEIDIEGSPVSLSCKVSAYASLTGKQRFHAGDPTTPAWFITAVTMIQAIPRVVAAEPGLVYASVFAHAAPDFRLLDGRNSVVG